MMRTTLSAGFGTALLGMALLLVSCTDDDDDKPDGGAGAPQTGGQKQGSGGRAPGSGGRTGGTGTDGGAGGDQNLGGSVGGVAGDQAVGGVAGGQVAGAAGDGAGGSGGRQPTTGGAGGGPSTGGAAGSEPIGGATAGAAGGPSTGGTTAGGSATGGAGGGTGGVYEGPAEELPCEVDAANLSEDHDLPFIAFCPAGCTDDPGAIWGTDVYTSDSAVCPALIHAGVLPASGGYALVTFAEGQLAYRGSTRNGIESLAYAGWGESFYGQPIDANGDPIGDPPDVTDENTAHIDCVHSGFTLPNEVGRSILVDCPVGCDERRIWGTEVYTLDSNLCTAAAHMGLIELDEGGSFIFTALGSQESFTDSTQNGITSSSYGAYDHSYTLSEPEG